MLKSNKRDQVALTTSLSIMIPNLIKIVAFACTFLLNRTVRRLNDCLHDVAAV